MVSKTLIKHKILLVGSGLMTPPLVDYLTSFNDTQITVASNIIKDAENLCKRAPQHMNAVYLDVGDVSEYTSDYSYSTEIFLGDCCEQASKRLQSRHFFCATMATHACLTSMHIKRNQRCYIFVCFTRYDET